MGLNKGWFATYEDSKANSYNPAIESGKVVSVTFFNAGSASNIMIGVVGGDAQLLVPGSSEVFNMATGFFDSTVYKYRFLEGAGPAARVDKIRIIVQVVEDN